MEIRKADAKGRLTGFTPGTYYKVTEPQPGEAIMAVPLPTTQESE